MTGGSVRSPRRRPRVSAIVPVYNERSTVAGVVATLGSSSLIDQIVCVDDGSTDGSAQVLESFDGRIELVRLAANRGKGAAMAEGLERAVHPIVAFFDADLVNLTADQVARVVTPVVDGTARAVLGYPDKTAPYPGIILAGYTGERAYRREDLWPHRSRMAAARFGVEVILNSIVPGFETRLVPLDGLVGLDKWVKHGSADAVREYWGEAVDITRELARQRAEAVGTTGTQARLRMIAVVAANRERARQRVAAVSEHAVVVRILEAIGAREPPS